MPAHKDEKKARLYGDGIGLAYDYIVFIKEGLLIINWKPIFLYVRKSNHELRSENTSILKLLENGSN